MMKKALISTASLLVLGAGCLALMGAAPKEAAEVGKAAPDFSLPSTAGKTVDLSSYRGKWVVLEWTNHQCPIVARHYRDGDMQKTQAWAAEKGVVWLQIVSSAAGKQGAITAAQGNDIMKSRGDKSTGMLLDPSGDTGRLYGAKTTPHMYIVDPKGTLLYNGAIDNDPSGRSASPTNYVVQGLTEAMAGKDVSTPTSRPYGCAVKY